MSDNAKLILEIIEASTEHLTAEQIYQKLLEGSTRMSLATIYNNLNSLYERGLIRKLVLSGQPDRYDRLYRHDHLICKVCGRISDVCLEDLSGRIEREMGIVIDSYDLRVFYTCPECRSRG